MGKIKISYFYILSPEHRFHNGLFDPRTSGSRRQPLPGHEDQRSEGIPRQTHLVDPYHATEIRTHEHHGVSPRQVRGNVGYNDPTDGSRNGPLGLIPGYRRL